MTKELGNKRKYATEQLKVENVKKCRLEKNEKEEEADSDAWEGLEMSSGNEGVSSNLARQPTHTELRTIQEASDLYRSNVFKLAIDSLLPNVRPKESRVKPLDTFLRHLYTTLSDLPPLPLEHPLEAARVLHKQGVLVPFPRPPPPESTAWKVSFEKPSNITLVGSWATKTIVKSLDNVSWTVDVAVEMPQILFQEKDYLDCRFFHKRAYYLAVLAAAVSNDKKLKADAFFDAQILDSRLPSLIVIPKNVGNPDTDWSKVNARVRIFPTLSPQSPISLRHLSPLNCNIRTKESIVNGDSENSLRNPVSGTPLYNSNILESVSSRERLLRTHELTKEVPSLRDSLSLLRVWANQRGYGPGSKEKGCVLGFERRGFFWTAILHLLINGEENFGQKVGYKARKKVGKGLSSYQLFRAALDFLARHDFSSEPIFMKDGSRFSPEKYETIRPVFIDFCSVNICAGIPLSSLDSLRQDARTTLDLLNISDESKISTFDEVLLVNKRQLMSRYDVVISVDAKKVSLRKSNVTNMLDHGSHPAYILSEISSILRQALGNRVLAITIIVPTSEHRPLSQQSPSSSIIKMQIGLRLNRHNAFRLVDHGPPASEETSDEARIFRELWGDKAELRRFKDGRIIESVVWEMKNIDERARIPTEIVRLMLSRHFGIDVENDVRCFQNDFDGLLRVPESLVTHVVLPNAQPGFKSALTAFDNLVRVLKGLEDDIPLAVLNVSAVSSDLRYTSAFTPIPLPLKDASSVPFATRYLPAINIVLQFERSGRWPDDLSAIQKMKLAFFEQLSEALMKKVSGLRTNIVLSPIRAISDTLITESRAHLEIITPDGWAFAARIWHDREATLLIRALDTKTSPVPTMPQSIDRAIVTEAYKFYLIQYNYAPRHHRAVASLTHRFSAYAGTIRLVSRWLASHWILPHVSHEAIELLCAYAFVGDQIRRSEDEEQWADVPMTKELGFFRVLAFLKKWSWESGLFVAIHDSETEDRTTQSGSAENGSDQLNVGFSGKGVWTISTSVDREGRVWTSDGPDALTARRIKTLASASLEYVLEHEYKDLVPRALFLHPTDDYDVLIKLRKDVICRTHQRLVPLSEGAHKEKRYKNLVATSPEDEEPLRVGFDPALMYYSDLKRVFEGTMAFFYDPFGGGTIGGVWDPSLRSKRPFRVLNDYSSKPSGLEAAERQEKPRNEVELNTASVLAEMERLGEGLVSAIEVLR